MIVEHAVLEIRPGSGPAFETAFAEAKSVVAPSGGFVALELLRGIESPDRYTLLIRWETLADHVEGFRGSSAFGRWRELIGPFFASPPVVEHCDPVVALG